VPAQPRRDRRGLVGGVDISPPARHAGSGQARYESADHEAASRRHLLTLGMAAYTTSGVIGRPSLGTAEKGKALLDSLTQLAAKRSKRSYAD
jgi:creatinine amidohydrolase/Fe(II)-dependent formamide hydrolase-like protein